MADGEKPLRKISEAFKSLEAKVNSQPENVEIASFSHACSLVSPLFSCLGIAFKFAEMDYVAKVEDLREASKSIVTLNSMMELDIQQNSVRKGGSHTRNLLRVKRGLDMVKILFEQIIAADGNSLKGPASTAYAQVFAPHHGWAIRKAVAAGMYALPTKAQLLKKLNEDVKIIENMVEFSQDEEEDDTKPSVPVSRKDARTWQSIATMKKMIQSLWYRFQGRMHSKHQSHYITSCYNTRMQPQVF